MGIVQEQAKLSFARDIGAAPVAYATGTTKQVGLPGVAMVSEVNPLPVSIASADTQSAVFYITGGTQVQPATDAGYVTTGNPLPVKNFGNLSTTGAPVLIVTGATPPIPSLTGMAYVHASKPMPVGIISGDTENPVYFVTGTPGVPPEAETGYVTTANPLPVQAFGNLSTTGTPLFVVTGSPGVQPDARSAWVTEDKPVPVGIVSSTTVTVQTTGNLSTTGAPLFIATGSPGVPPIPGIAYVLPTKPIPVGVVSGTTTGRTPLMIMTGTPGAQPIANAAWVTPDQPLPVTPSAGDGLNTYYSVPTGNPDFNVTVSAGTRTIRMTNVDFTPDAACIALPDNVKVLVCGATEVVRRIPTNQIRVTPGATGIYNVTFSGMTFTFNTTDIIAMKMIGPTKNRDAALNTEQVGEISPTKAWRVVKENLVTGVTIGNVNDTWKDQGVEIDMRELNALGIFVIFTANTTTGGAMLQVLSKNTYAGANEYKMVSTGSYQMQLGTGNTKSWMKFGTSNLVDYVQIQTKGTTLGATTGTVTIDITKAYNAGGIQ